MVIGDGRFRFEYYEHHFPLAPRTYLLLMRVGADTLTPYEHRLRAALPEAYVVLTETSVPRLWAALAEGEIAGLGAAGQSVNAELLRLRDRHRHFAARMDVAFALRDELRTGAR